MTFSGSDLVSRRPRAAHLAALLSAACLVVAFLASPFPAHADVVTRSAKPGAVTGTSENSDAFIWRLMTNQIAIPVDASQPTSVAFETWASDADTFSQSPHWPGANEAKRFHGSVLAKEKTSGAAAGALDVQCAPPLNARVGGFPTTGTPNPCIAEEVRRNRAQYDYIVNNGLNTQSGLRSAYARSFKVDMPASAIAVKGDWVPVPTLMQWVPQLKNMAEVEKNYLTTQVGSAEYALVALHVSSKRNPYWVWGTFENRLNPGRCDYLGCSDSFGAVTRSTPANFQAYNSDYGACPKSAALQAMMTKSHLSPVWNNYCLKGTMVDFVASDGTPQALGNSVIEGINADEALTASSCITCHAYASFGSAGTPAGGATSMLDYNAIGKPVPGPLVGSRPFDFNWGVLLAP